MMFGKPLRERRGISLLGLPVHITIFRYEKSPFVGIVGRLYIPLLRTVDLTPLSHFPLKAHFGRHL